MARFLPALDERLCGIIRRQHLFFTATAPHQGRVNLSPKGLGTFRILDTQRVGYLDLTGSGNETAAHLLQNGRITFMFCTFEGSPLIIRLYARGRAVRSEDVEWAELRPLFGEPVPGERQLIIADIESVQTSCGCGVPLFSFESERSQLIEWAERKGPEGLVAYRAEKNTHSVDGLPTGHEG